MDRKQPYLSVVVTARNDDHGGNLLERMQLFVGGWISQTRHFNLSSELIIVEWNPPADRPRLQDALRWPEDLGTCRVRFIEVPGELHGRYANAVALPLYQMIAKNVGIRRAQGQFVLATNIDILFSNELIAFLAEQRLDPDRMYRVDRCDAKNAVPLDCNLDEQLEYCRTHLLRINTREGTFPITSDDQQRLPKKDEVPRPLVSQRKMPLEVWAKVQGVIDRISKAGPVVIITLPVPRILKRMAAFYIRWGGITGILRNMHLIGRELFRHTPVSGPASLERQPLLTKDDLPAEFKLLHSNGCGDFTLVAREHWFDLRGYPEFDLFSMNIDSVFCYAAHYGGVREEVLPDPMRIYHIEHATGSGWTPEGQEQLFKRIAAKGLEFVSYGDVIGWAEQMRRLKCTMIFNHENWGLANFDLKETQPEPGAVSMPESKSVSVSADRA